MLYWTDNTHGGLVWRRRVNGLRILQLRLREPQAPRANPATRRSDGAGARVALLQVIMSNQDTTQPIARPAARSWLPSIAGTVVAALVASLLTGCFIETGRYHHHHRAIVIR